MIHSQEYSLPSKWKTKHEHDEDTIIIDDLIHQQLILSDHDIIVHENELQQQKHDINMEIHIEQYEIISGDEVEIHMQIDLIQIQIIWKQDSDHVIVDIMYQVDENEMH